MDKIELSITEDTFEFIVDKAIEFKLGARGLRAICETIMIDPMFELPSTKINEFKLNLDYAKKKIEQAKVSRLKAS